MRFFNTVGPIDAALHYHVPSLARLGLNNVMLLVQQHKYFTLRAPRQTGKTSALLALRDELNERGEHRCVYVNVEVAQSYPEDVGAAMHAILSAIALAADDDALDQAWPKALTTVGPHFALRETLARWSLMERKPIVLMIDEIDALIGDTLLAVLRQLRAGYPDRPNRFPQSVILCGIRDVRDYRIRSNSDEATVLGSSVFNISAKSVRLANLSPAEVDSLLGQHTEATGQAFTEAARRDIWNLSQGQPWLVNALAYKACFDSEAGLDRCSPIVAQAIQEAREQLLLSRETHLDLLADNLQEDRVRRVIQPLLTGAKVTDPITTDDIQYVRDLGLVTEHDPISIANPIYRDLIPRYLTSASQAVAF